jgi:uncharacterized protein YbjT (DUF2867 family)
MKVVVIGGTGLIGSKVVTNLTKEGHEAIAASPDSGVNTVTGEGLDAVLEGVHVVIDVSNSPSFEDAAVMDFFSTATTNLMKAESAAGVGHHVALSIVNNDLIPDSGYMRAKAEQERIIRESGLAYSIVRATQFFEFSKSIAQGSTVNGVVRLPAVRYQPMAAADVALAVSRVAVGPPLNGTTDIGGPLSYSFAEFIERALADQGDPRQVIADPRARYFGAVLSESMLVPDEAARLGTTTYEEWLAAQPA